MARFVGHVLAVITVVAAFSWHAVPASAQVELDRIVSRINGHIITESDVRQARTLKLVADTSSNDATQRGLEDRLLMLADLDRTAPVAGPSDAAVAAHRAAWAKSLGAGADALAGRSGMSSQDLQVWMRDDLRIQAYVTRQFGMIPEAERAQAQSDWLSRLRQRAESR